MISESVSMSMYAKERRRGEVYKISNLVGCNVSLTDFHKLMVAAGFRVSRNTVTRDLSILGMKKCLAKLQRKRPLKNRYKSLN